MRPTAISTGNFPSNSKVCFQRTLWSSLLMQSPNWLLCADGMAHWRIISVPVNRGDYGDHRSQVFYGRQTAFGKHQLLLSKVTSAHLALSFNFTALGSNSSHWQWLSAVYQSRIVDHSGKHGWTQILL